MARPLDGITVVSLEHVIAAPFCTRQLADLEARAIKVERPGAGDYSRILAALLQRSRTGEGSHIDVSMLQSLGEWMVTRCITLSRARRRHRAPRRCMPVFIRMARLPPVMAGP